MAENDCLGQIQACAVRVSRLEANGAPQVGVGNLITTDALVTSTITPVYTDGEQVTQNTACGATYIDHRSADTLTRGDISLQFVTMSPPLMAMLSGGTVLTAFDGDRKGFAGPDLGPVTTDSVSVEIWAKRIDVSDLDQDSPYAWHAYPLAKNLRQSAWTHANGAILPEFTGQLYENANWGDGPTNDWPAASTQAWQWIPTDELPEITCAAQELVAS